MVVYCISVVVRKGIIIVLCYCCCNVRLWYCIMLFLGKAVIVNCVSVGVK